MRFRLTVLLLIANIAVLFSIWILDRRPSASASAPGNFLDFTRLEISGKSIDKPRVLKLEGNRWRIVSPIEWSANYYAVNRIKNQLEYLNEDTSFPVSDLEKHGQTLADYGLDDPICTIDLTLEDDQAYTITLGDFSTMDSQRYVSIGDGNVYLVQTDPLDYFDLELRDLIDQDDVPYLSQAQEIRFSGTQTYTVTYEEDSPNAYCEEDRYYTQQDGETLPLDTSRVEDYLNLISYLDLTNYVTYTADEEMLAQLPKA